MSASPDPKIDSAGFAHAGPHAHARWPVWMTAADVARSLQITTDQVYASEALRRVARKLGNGPRPRLRWLPADLERAFPCEDVRVVASGGAASDDAPGGRLPEARAIRRRRRRTTS